ncbi:hypothetical protein [Lacipirellula parvula]|uniref:Uncharacterized protein n=1 Tax=Lacipirellula parvula TaxID=2650471 RepID=A0A5K7X5J6_9BACT|nr:hypothetical protein [Lacipirellula parvula]BBO31102.1 hypothetical protein PLANPX_0714 [Lacipirellula parvula]
MIDPDVEADWLQDTLTDVARRMRRPGANAAELAECATVLEWIVADLRGLDYSGDLKPVNYGRKRRGWIDAAVAAGLILLLRRLFTDDSNSKS